MAAWRLPEHKRIIIRELLKKKIINGGDNLPFKIYFYVKMQNSALNFWKAAKKKKNLNDIYSLYS